MTRTAPMFIAAVLLAVPAGPGDARAQACGPYRVQLADGPGGETRCAPISAAARGQILRARKLIQTQERRVRALDLRQRQRAREQEQRSQREAERQRLIARRQSTQTQQPAIDNEQNINYLETLNRQAADKARRDQAFREHELEIQARLLQQEIELLKSDLESDQRVFERFLEKEQQRDREGR